MSTPLYTPDPMRVEDLPDNGVFVFGSNEAGIHGAGAARFAMEKLGAVSGVGAGRCGRCFAIPTKDEQIKTLPLIIIGEYVKMFIRYARRHQDLLFFVTPIGCGLAGYKADDIAPLFAGLWADKPKNIVWPETFVRHFNNQ